MGKQMGKQTDREITISEETYQKIKGQLQQDDVTEINNYEDMIGMCVYIRTVTYHQLGRVASVGSDLIRLEDASWVGDSGRWMQAIKEGKLNEVEPTGTMFVNRDAIVDVTPWVHDLPTEQK